MFNLSLCETSEQGFHIVNYVCNFPWRLPTTQNCVDDKQIVALNFYVGNVVIDSEDDILLYVKQWPRPRAQEQCLGV